MAPPVEAFVMVDVGWHRRRHVLEVLRPITMSAALASPKAREVGSRAG